MNDSPSVTPQVAELRKELFRALCERTTDPLVAARLTAVIRELRLVEGVGDRTRPSLRSQDPVVDVLLRLLGMGDQLDQPPKLERQLDPEQARAAWVATRPIEGEEEQVADDELPTWAVSVVDRKTRERVFIGFRPDEEKDLAQLDDAATLEELFEELGMDAPTDQGLAREAFPELEPMQPKDGSLVSFAAADEIDAALVAEVEKVASVYHDPLARYLGQGPEEVDAAMDEGEEEEDQPSQPRIAATGLTDDGLDPRSATPAPAEGVDERKSRALAEAERILEKRKRSATAPAAPTREELQAQLDAEEAAERAERERKKKEAEALEQQLVNQRVRGFAVATFGLIALMILGTLGARTYNQSIAMNAAAARSAAARSALYNAVSSDPKLAEAVGGLGGNGQALTNRYLAFDEAEDEVRVRAALAYAAALEAEWSQAKGSGTRFAQTEQTVRKLLRARDDYRASVVVWEEVCGGFWGSAAGLTRLGSVPDDDALVPLP